MAWAANDPGVIAWMNNIDGAWTGYTPTLTNWTGTITHARYKIIGKTGYAQGSIAWLTGTGGFVVSLPFTLHAGVVSASISLGNGIATDVSAPANLPVTLQAFSSTSFVANSGAGATVGPAVPMTWAAGDSLKFNIITELA